MDSEGPSDLGGERDAADLMLIALALVEFSRRVGTGENEAFELDVFVPLGRGGLRSRRGDGTSLFGEGDNITPDVSFGDKTFSSAAPGVGFA